MSNLAPSEVPRFYGGPLPTEASTQRAESGFSRLAHGLGNVAYRMVAQTSNVDARSFVVTPALGTTSTTHEQPDNATVQRLENEVVWLEH